MSTEAEQITAGSRSNLALAFIAMPRARRAGITTFYAFCRLIDDIADAPDLSVAEKQHRLDLWKRSLFQPEPGEPRLAAAIRALIAEYHLRENHLLEIIAGVEMDLTPRRYATVLELRLYCYRVASVVGLVSIEIFGYQNPDCQRYATELGLALQLTNILRDVGEDFANDRRLYLPLDDLAQFGLTEPAFPLTGPDPRWEKLVQFEAARARAHFAAAHAALPLEDRRTMAPAEIMSRVYQRLLRKIERHPSATWQRRLRLHSLEKFAAIFPVLIRAWAR